MIYKDVCGKCGALRVDKQLGLEPSPQQYLRRMVRIFRELNRVLRPDGTLWLNMGDCHATHAGITGRAPGGGIQGERWKGGNNHRDAIGPKSQPNRIPFPGSKQKDMVGMPWRLAFALQRDGWYLRQDIIWHKPNPMPESVQDRPTKSHEYIFLLSKRAHYYYDATAIKEPASPESHARYARGRGENPKYANGEQPLQRSFDHMAIEESDAPMLGVNPKAAQVNGHGHVKQNGQFSAAVKDLVEMRNKRSVWTIPTYSYKGAHYATFPPDLVRPCILAGSKPGDVILDPFGGSGTVGMVAIEYDRSAILIDLNPFNETLMRERCNITPGFPGL